MSECPSSGFAGGFGMDEFIWFGQECLFSLFKED
jgi:hypothetical protein